MTDDTLNLFSRIKLLVMDIDGVMTDGHIVYGDYGDEIKFFDSQDGFGLALLKQAGIKTAMISSRKSKVNVRRAKDLKIDKLFQGSKEKSKACSGLIKKFRLQPQEVCVIGDDWIDVPMMKLSAARVAVANAVPAVKEIAHYVTERSGGRGAIREVVELILRAQNKWDSLFERYFSK